ncbi:tRNA (uridine(34)/cytosine(34)/5-carboxymethylaminomethyluridine(34)-2'-O)-methyltransferase TrmL [Corynebacterium sp. CNJ-954]|uniref:tRNA (cytidine(34)-2'-O)-methyltransferase n=1 Tax=Corynebacterium sp. CNJ-954 TaxID=1904962 RepID=UPI0009626D5B|nr:tRNA (uridine(34)/cytosine(34)/5-carboxymethylaminomethyluridine(34)-2'-O)-methyltransferase TrmL [Corynebacterium sp. CNJ-954]
MVGTVSDTTGPTGTNPYCHILFEHPAIPGNTGSAIRLCAGTGASLHLAEPLGFNFDDKHLKRAGLDYHDLADVHVHPSLDSALTTLTGPAGARVIAFTAHADTWHTDIDYEPGDVLLFGTEPTGLTEEALADPRITRQVRIPMLPGRRSMNLSNAAAVAAYEAWRQAGFPGGR